jgi:RNA polymerase sigma-70 factor, ECF subfamily
MSREAGMIESEHVGEIWRRYYDRLLGFVRSKVESPEEAEDILQELFIRVHLGICCMQEWTVIEKLVYRISRNLIIDRYRISRAAEELPDDIEGEYGMPELDEDPVAKLAFSLRETVDELPEPYRSALIATEYDGLTQSQLAELEGISLSAAKSRVQRARAKLKEALLECCHFELDGRGGIMDYHERCCRCHCGQVKP